MPQVLSTKHSLVLEVWVSKVEASEVMAMEDDLEVDPDYESLELGGSMSVILPLQLLKAFCVVVGE